MDKETLSNYGWIVICVLVLACMLALATPFGNFVAEGFKATYVSFWQGGENAIETVIKPSSPTPEQLQQSYKFDYYSSVALAAKDVYDDTVGQRADCSKEDAVAGIADIKGRRTIVVFKDNKETESATIKGDVTLYLGGHKLEYVGVGVVIVGGNVLIDGKISGSEITTTSAEQNYAVCASKGRVTIDGGTYKSQSNGSENVYTIYSVEGGTFKNLTAYAESTNGITVGIYIGENANETTIENVKLRATVVDKQASCIVAFGDISVANADCVAYSPDTAFTTAIYAVKNAELTNSTFISDSYGGYLDQAIVGLYVKGKLNANNIKTKALSSGASQGIQVWGDTVIKNSEIYGVHSGIQTGASIRIENTTSEGFLHGGLMAADVQDRATEIIIKNSVMSQIEMRSGKNEYTTDFSFNSFLGAAIYLEGSGKEVNTYIDNTIFNARVHAIVLHSSVEAKNVYISRSTFNNNIMIRNDDNKNKVYDGADNKYATQISNRPASTVKTDEIYAK